MEAQAVAQKVCPACNSRYGAEVSFCSRDGTPLVADPSAGRSDLVGQVIADRYRVVKLLGEGGMGQVYEAQHVNINKRFALKLLRPEIVSNEEAVARFRQEAWSASSIGHENIVEIDDFATLPNGSVYLAMEFLRGESMSERMRRAPLAVDEALAILIQVASGLHAAHDKGIVHRDMKPENVFLAEKHGRVVVKILDFGIAKVSGAEGSQSLTRTGTIFGTPHYMSPEQALGRPLDHRTDVYSVGVIMYEAFTGRVPFEAESFMGILTKHITVQPVPPRELAPDRAIPPEVEALILRAMAKEADDRPQSMAELLEALRGLAGLHAPHLLGSPSGTMPAQPGTPARMAAAAPRSTPVGLPAQGARSSASRPAHDTTLAPEATLDPPPRRGRVGLYALFALGLAGGVAGMVSMRRAPAPHVPSSPAASAQAAAGSVAPAPLATPARARDIVILLDSEPLGAQIFRGDVHLGDTPLNIPLTDNKPETVVLKKPGYLPKTVVLERKDGKDGERQIVRLVREEPKEPKTVLAKGRPASSKITSSKAAPRSTPGTAPPKPSAPKPPPLISAPPLVNPPPARPKPRTHADPYGRVDDNKKTGDSQLLDSY